MTAGFLYVLTHSSDPNLYKIGVTVHHPAKRLAQHNRLLEKYAGQVVKETGEKWQLKTYIAVQDRYWAEAKFWGATPLADIPFLGGVEVQRLESTWVQTGLEAAIKAGVRPPPGPLPAHVYAYNAWMNRRLAGRGVTLVGDVLSKYGRSSFRCTQGHEWRTMPSRVADGEGCPICGTGQRTPEEMLQAVRPAFLCLLTHPDRPDVVRVEMVYDKLQRLDDGWEIHRYRSVEEPALAESLFWEALDCFPPVDGEPMAMELRKAEQAFRDIVGRIHQQTALAELAREARSGE